MPWSIANDFTAMKIAKERKSSVLASNAIHHRVDSLTSIVALLTIGGSHFITNASWLDPVGGLIISFMVIRAGWGNFQTSLLELADVTIDEEVKASVRRAATKALKGDAGKGLAGVAGGDQVTIKDIQGIKSGQNYLVDIDLAVPSAYSVHETSQIENAVRERLGAKVRGVRRVGFRFTPDDSASDFSSEFISANISPRSSPEPEDEHADHHHSSENEHDHHQHRTREESKKSK